MVVKSVPALVLNTGTNCKEKQLENMDVKVAQECVSSRGMTRKEVQFINTCDRVVASAVHAVPTTLCRLYA